MGSSTDRGDPGKQIESNTSVWTMRMKQIEDAHAIYRRNLFTHSRMVGPSFVPAFCDSSVPAGIRSFLPAWLAVPYALNFTNAVLTSIVWAQMILGVLGLCSSQRIF